MGHSRDWSREGIGRRDRDAPWADAAQGLAELLQPRALIEGIRCLATKIPGHSQRCSGRHCARQELSSRESRVVCHCISSLCALECADWDALVPSRGRAVPPAVIVLNIRGKVARFRIGLKECIFPQLFTILPKD